MAYSRKIREAARRYWLLGYSDEKVIQQLAKDFPDEPQPKRADTIYDWRRKENWEADLEIIEAKARQKREEMLADEIGRMGEKQLGLLNQLEAHVQLLMTRLVKNEQGRPVDTQLTANELAQISLVLDRTVKNQRLIRGLATTQAQIDASVDYDINVEELTDEQLERLAAGEPPALVLGNPRHG